MAVGGAVALAMDQEPIFARGAGPWAGLGLAAIIVAACVYQWSYGRGFNVMLSCGPEYSALCMGTY